MQKEFSTAWVSSKQPRKQRKYVFNAPLHIQKKLVNANLSKELRKKLGKRSIALRKNDEVKVMRGKFKGHKGKVLRVSLKKQLIEVEGVQTKKLDGSKVNIRVRPSNVQIVEVNREDKKRNKILNKEDEKKSEVKTDINKKAEGRKE